MHQSFLHNGRLALCFRPWIELLEGRIPPGNLLASVIESQQPPDLEHAIHEGRIYPGQAEFLADWTLGGMWTRGLIEPESSKRRSDVTEVSQERRPLMDDGAGKRGAPDAALVGLSLQVRGASALGPAVFGTTSIGLVPAAQRLTNPALLKISPLREQDSLLLALPAADAGAASQAEAETDAKVAERFGRLPLSFEQNVGQTDAQVDFLARAGGYTIFLTSTGAVFSLMPEVKNDESALGALTQVRLPENNVGVSLHMQIAGGNPEATAAGLSPLSGKANYFIGNDPPQWRTNIATYGRVEYENVYPGVDLVYYGNNGELEYDFIVAPGADPSQIAFNFAGADGLDINPRGDLVIYTAAGDLIHQKPYLYQEVDGVRKEVTGNFVLSTDLALNAQHSSLVTFEVGGYDVAQPLVIDPLVLGYSTFLGGTRGEHGYGIAVDSGGNALVTGFTNSTDFPATPGAFDTSYNGADLLTDVFVAKLNASGTGLVYSTFLGGSNDEAGTAIAVDGGGNAYITGYTVSTNFPVTPTAFDITHNGGIHDAFVAKLRADGAGLLYSTFLGGLQADSGAAIALDATGSAYATGLTRSSLFPVTPGAFDITFNAGYEDAFVTKLNATGSALAYSTFLGGSNLDHGNGIAVDSIGNAYVTGETQSMNFPTTPGAFDTSFNGASDAYVVKLSAAGAALDFATFLGGFGFDGSNSIARHGGGNLFVTGTTGSPDFPTTPGAFDTTFNGGTYDSFVAELHSAGTDLSYATYLGGSSHEYGLAIGAKTSGSAYVTGYTCSSDFPITPDALDHTNGSCDAFVSKLKGGGAGLGYSTYLGGIGSDWGYAIAVDGGGSAYVTGQASAMFPTTPGAFDTSHNGNADTFVTKFCERACRVPTQAKPVLP